MSIEYKVSESDWKKVQHVPDGEIRWARISSSPNSDFLYQNGDIFSCDEVLTEDIKAEIQFSGHSVEEIDMVVVKFKRAGSVNEKEDEAK